MLDFKLKLGLSLMLVVLLLDLYSWQAVKTIFRKRPQPFLNFIKSIHFGFTVIALVLIFGQFFINGLEMSKMFRTYAAAFIFIVYLSKLLVCTFLFADDIIRFVKWIRLKVTKKPAVTKVDDEGRTKISRAKFISQTGMIAGAAPLILLSKGIIKGAYDYRIHQVPLYLPKLPSAFNGLKIVQVSDIHSGSFFNKDAVKRGIDMIRDARPDLIFFTGDLVNSKTEESYDYADIFSQIKAPMGVFSIFGNHDYGDYVQWDSPEAKRKNLEDLVQVHKDLGWHLMRNENVTLDKGMQRIGLVGVENWGDRGRFQKFGDIDKAKNGLPDVPVKLLLSHDPSHFDSIVSVNHKDIDATFSGHTHGFQFGIEMGNIRWSPSQYIYPHWAGLYNVGGQQLYVNRGFGFLGYPGRVGILPEITVFELRNS